MPDLLPGTASGAQDAILFGVAADLTYNIFSATNSSPQTTELFASARAATLWKYVRLGALQTTVLVGVMAARALSDGARRAMWCIAGGVMAGGSMALMYAHALQAGGGTPQ